MIGRVRAREGDSRAIDRVHARTKVFTNIAAPPLARDGQLPAQVARVLKLPPTRQDGGLEHRPATSPRPVRLHGKLPARTSPRPPSRAAPYPTSFVPDYPPFFTLRARRRWRRAQLTATPPPLVSPESAFRITRVSRVPSLFFLVTLYVMSRHCNTTPWSVGRISPTAIFDIAAVCRRPARMSLKMKEKPATRAEHVFVVRSEVVHGVIRVDDKALQKSAFHESVYPLANLTPFRSYFLLYIS